VHVQWGGQMMRRSSFIVSQFLKIGDLINTINCLDILSATGPDFGLMHDFIPTRTRAELKKKFKKEERTSIARVNEVSFKLSILCSITHFRL
jgi:hypothetical protein